MRADRLFSMLMLLQARRKITAQRLAEELEVSRRTILRDIDALSAAGIPIYAEGGRGGGIRLDEHFQVALSGLKPEAMRALFVSGMPSLLKDVGLSDNAESSLLQLFAALPNYHQQAAEHVRQRLHIDPMWWWYTEAPMPFWPDLQRAVFEDLCVCATYERHDGSISERVLQPYSLVGKASVWYLVARRDGDSEFRTYRVSRFRDVMLLKRRFERDADFDIAAYWDKHVQEARANFPKFTFTLRLPKDRLDFLKFHIPGNSEIVELAAGDDWAALRVSVPDFENAKMLVFGIGAGAEILDPPELRKALLSAARALVEHSST